MDFLFHAPHERPDFPPHEFTVIESDGVLAQVLIEEHFPNAPLEFTP